MTGISTVAAVATEVGILRVGLGQRQESSVTAQIVVAFPRVCVCDIQQCATRYLQRSQA